MNNQSKCLNDNFSTPANQSSCASISATIFHLSVLFPGDRQADYLLLNAVVMHYMHAEIKNCKKSNWNAFTRDRNSCNKDEIHHYSRMLTNAAIWVIGVITAGNVQQVYYNSMQLPHISFKIHLLHTKYQYTYITKAMNWMC